ncbi:MAG: hypothetical protein ACRBDL_06345 [Alphaproteobacteria bacterium]
MIPNNSIATMYVRIAGENSLLAMAQNNLLSNLDRVVKVRTHTFLANNGQTEDGISQNFGDQRHYSWNDTVIDCRHCPDLIDSELLPDFCETITENKRFIVFKGDIEERLGGLIQVTPFYSVLRGEDNMRYNIRSASVEDFDMIRVGLQLTASDADAFSEGLAYLKKSECPLNAIRRSMANA